ncbi:MAG: S8 family peptidase [Roseiflexaceae bacterium]
MFQQLRTRVIGVIVVVLALVTATFGVLSAAPAVPPATVDMSLRALAQDVAVPVIITMRTADAGADMSTLSVAEIDARASRIGVQRTAVVARNTNILKLTKTQPAHVPLVFARMSPRDLDALASDPSVASIHPDRLAKPALYESTTLIGSASANVSGYAGAGTSVAVLDTGVLSGHEFLSGQVVDEACFSTTDSAEKSTSVCPGGAGSSFAIGAGEPCPIDCDHGTHVAGIVAGKKITYGGQTFSGVAPAAKIIAVQVFSQFARSACGVGATGPCVMSFESDQISALDWLYTNRNTGDWGTLASVNMSLGGGEFGTLNACNTDPIKASIDTLRSAGVATVIASGNEDLLTAIGAPACVSSAIAVGASTAARSGTLDAPASFSNRPRASANNPNALGDRLLDLMAPGNLVMSSIATTTRSYEDYPGTSMATPHVAGAWAVLKGVVPGASVTQVLGWLRTTGKTIVDRRNGDPLSIPRIDVGAAVAKANAELTASPTATRTPSRTPTRTRSSTRTATRNPKQSATKTRTKTRTASRTKTATHTPVPTTTASATPLPAWSTSVTNGGFESGLTGWTESSAQGYDLLSLASGRYLPRSGTYFMYLGGVPNETSILETTLTIPAEATYLRLHTFVYSPETVCGNDVTTVTLDSAVVSTIPLCYATNSTLGYVPFSINVSALRGLSVPLEIKTVTNGTLTSHFLVDDVGYVSAPTDSIFRFSSGLFDYPVEDVIRRAP